MSDVFLSYAREDFEAATALATRLEASGLTVWWDRKIPPGRTFREVIQEQLETTRCVVVLWSKASIDSDWVVDEAEEGRLRKCLVPVRLDEAIPPLGFRRIHALSLLNDASSWQEETVTELIEAVGRVAKKSISPTSDVDPPRPQSPVTSRSDGWLATGPKTVTMWATLSLAVVVLAVHVEFFFELGDSHLPTILAGPMLLVGLWVGVAGFRRGSKAMTILGWLGPFFPTYCLTSASPNIYFLLVDIPDSDTSALLLFAANFALVSYLSFTAVKESRRPDSVHEELLTRQTALRRIHLIAASFVILLLLGVVVGWTADTVWLLFLRLAAVTMLFVAVLQVYVGTLIDRKLTRHLLAILAAFVLVGGNIAIQIVDKDGQSLPGVVVELSGLSITAVSDISGTVALPMVPLGPYGTTVAIEGFEKRSIEIVAWPFFSPKNQVSLGLETSEEASSTIADPPFSEAALLAIVAAFLAVLTALQWPRRFFS